MIKLVFLLEEKSAQEVLDQLLPRILPQDVSWLIHIIRNLFGLKKVRELGLSKNRAQLFALFGLAHL